ncbi:MAG: hypothetical protein BWK73_21745 [Thiothrix lacustris]|uniref:Uncharacterized protein n=1 Tax=Thiothrix lacustris TaxID=525917 RepID=A0A1Y1QNW0_9GAMM|nr:MAG: hypothetical protein BWK73_21745 [Thiothrix lacustris]
MLFNQMLSDFKRPFNIITTVIAIISILFSIYTYHDGKREREPYYFIHSVKTIVSNPDKVSTLKLLDKNGDVVKGNVYLTEISIWNEGRIAIEKNDIRIPIKVKFDNISRVLDFSINKEPTPEVSNFSVSEFDQKTLNLDWTHLDPKLGARIQVIIEGSEEPRISLTGMILDAEIKRAESFVGKYIQNNEVKGVLVLVILTILILLPVYSLSIFSPRSNWTKTRKIIYSLVYLLIGYGCAWLIAQWLFSIESPPF